MTMPAAFFEADAGSSALAHVEECSRLNCTVGWDAMNKHQIEISKFLSYVLRHQPDAIGIKLDAEGWTNIAELLAASVKAGKGLDHGLLETVVTANDKKRFAISEDGLRIRATQGHSSKDVNITFEERTPPDWLYHGTATRFLESIRKEGLKPGSRQYVHLSQEPITAVTVGQRYGEPVVLRIRASQMLDRGFKFYRAENGVWLVATVPTEFIAE